MKKDKKGGRAEGISKKHHYLAIASILIIFFAIVYYLYQEFGKSEINLLTPLIYLSSALFFIVLLIVIHIHYVKKKSIEKKVNNRAKDLGLALLLFLLSLALLITAIYFMVPVLIITAIVFMILSFIVFEYVKKRSKEISNIKSVKLVKELGKGFKVKIGKYETELDAVYKIVQEKGRVKLSTISRYLGVKNDTAEEWAMILEEHKLIKIHYHAFSGPELRKWEQ
ncbi:hypothetical protein ACFLZX_02780 [Nanoarchaeota archaeon]